LPPTQCSTFSPLGFPAIFRSLKLLGHGADADVGADMGADVNAFATTARRVNK